MSTGIPARSVPTRRQDVRTGAAGCCEGTKGGGMADLVGAEIGCDPGNVGGWFGANGDGGWTTGAGWKNGVCSANGADGGVKGGG